MCSVLATNDCPRCNKHVTFYFVHLLRLSQRSRRCFRQLRRLTSGICIRSACQHIVPVKLTPLTQVSRLPGSRYVSAPGRQAPDSRRGPRHLLRVLAHGLAARHSPRRGSGCPRWDYHDGVTAPQPPSSVHDAHHGGARHQLPGRVLRLPHAEAGHCSLGPRHPLHGQSSDRGK